MKSPHCLLIGTRKFLLQEKYAQYYFWYFRKTHKVIGTENIISIWLDQEVIAHVIHHKTEHEISSGFP